MRDSLLLIITRVVETAEEKLAHFADPHLFCVYGASGYGRGNIIKEPFSRAETLPDRAERAPSKAMGKLRKSVVGI